jgi:secretion/DNA translocation related TadE-like protein
MQVRSAVASAWTQPATHIRRDQGSAVVLALVCIALVTTVAWALLLSIDLTIGHLRARTAADMSALAAARNGCPSAQVIARSNGASLTQCAANASGLSAHVTVQAIVSGDQLIHFTVGASARAGPPSKVGY